MQQLVAQYLLQHGSQPTAWLLPLAASSINQVVRLGLAGSSHNSHHPPATSHLRHLAAQAEPVYNSEPASLGTDHLLHSLHESSQVLRYQGPWDRQSMENLPQPLYSYRASVNSPFPLQTPTMEASKLLAASVQPNRALIPAPSQAAVQLPDIIITSPRTSQPQPHGSSPIAVPLQPQTQQTVLTGDALVQYQQYYAARSQWDPHLHNHEIELRQQFKAQLCAELRAAKDEQQRQVQQLQSASAAGAGVHMPGPRALHRLWLPQLRMALNAQLAQARQLAVSQQGAVPAQASCALLWPALIQLGTEKVADTTLTVMMRHVLLSIAHEGGADERAGRQKGVGASFTRVAVSVAESLLDAVRYGALQESVLQEQPQRRKKIKHADGQDRLQKLLAVLEAANAGHVAGSKRSVGMLLKARQVADSLLAASMDMDHTATGQEGGHAAQLWPRDVKLQIGTELLAMALQSAYLPGGQPAIQVDLHTYQDSNITLRMLRPSPDLIRSMLRDDKLDARHLLDSRYQPMRVPPKPWTEYRKGGLLLPHMPAVRLAPGSDCQHLLEADRAGRLDKLKEALNTLGDTPWRINRRILDVVRQLSSMPGHVKTKLGVADSTHTISIPRPPTAWGEPHTQSSQQQKKVLPAGSDGHPIHDKGHTPYLRMVREGRGQLFFTAGPLSYREKLAWEAAAKAARTQNVNVLSLAMEHERRVAVAEALACEPRLYQPHSVDFRGRAYPMCMYLHHQGDDMQRSLLEFANGCALGQDGFRWLLIQLANCWGQGVDKLSLQGRMEFGEGCIPECKATAADPWSSAGSWWQNGDDPWQLLATALEVAAAVESGNPASYVSHLPVHQDGSCNGLQHYAAMARDYDGAVAVNLVPKAEPQDVYAAVARAVEAAVKQHAATEHRAEAIKLLQRNNNVVDRKLVKQTVMTTVYGVTFIGARDQIRARLSERGWQNENEVFQISSYLAKVTLASVSQVFATARPFMTWLAQSASCVTRTGKPVAWTAPFLGFPIKQPYFKEVAKGEEVVDRRAQRTAFPPNFIHSVDAAHMMMTALACKEAGVEFAGVHDSFFTHAGTVRAMNDILRHKFVELHSQPLLKNLAAEFEAQGAVDLPPIPKTGTLDINCVLDSPYFFS